MMTQVISISNQKGGVGKTTTAVNVSAAIAAGEKTCLLIDCDPQGNATTGLGLEMASLSHGLYDVLMGITSPWRRPSPKPHSPTFTFWVPRMNSSAPRWK